VVETSPNGSITYVADAAGRRSSVAVAGQPSVKYTFDNDNRMTQIAQGTSSIGFSYDDDSRRQNMTLPNGVTVGYSYDSASQLTGVKYALGSAMLGNLAYGYDLGGRRSSVGGSYARTGLPNSISSATFDASNQLTTWGTVTATYDANGNLLNDGGNSYVWNARNQLASMNASAESFQYDAFGRRVAKAILGTTTNFLYDGANTIQELSGSTPTANLITGNVDEYFERTDSVAAANFLTDGLGSTLALTDSSGNNLAQYTYDPYGNSTVVGSSTSALQYTGRENDGIGLYYYRARYYSPVFQRFISEDPIGLRAGPNTYRYVSDSPISRVDPSGLWQITISGGLGAGARFTIGNNGGMGLFDGQWNAGLYLGVGEGLDFDLDVFDRRCHAKGSNYGIEGLGQIGFGPHLEAEAHSGEDSWWNVNYGVPDTPFGGSIGTDGITVPTVGFGEAAVVGVGGTFYF
jgi:RHS repeat-associated protein